MILTLAHSRTVRATGRFGVSSRYVPCPAEVPR
jgi:hypothetical protein